MHKLLVLITANLLFFCTIALGGLPQVGYASFYGNKFNNHKTASGERYHKDALTAAHRSLPFGTLVKVTNLKNNKFVIVKINDRGPAKRSRIIDLSTAAAKAIDMIRSGVAKVKIELAEKTEVLPDGSTKEEANTPPSEDNKKKKDTDLKENTPKGSFLLQAGAYSIYENAEKTKSELTKKGFNRISIKQTDGKGSIYKVVVGPYFTKGEAEEVRKKLKKKGFDAFIIKK